VRRRHASHITVVLSKAAHSCPSVCLRARAPCPLRVSRPGANRAKRAAQAAGFDRASVPPWVNIALHALIELPCLLGSTQIMSPDVQLTHGLIALPRAFSGVLPLRTAARDISCDSAHVQQQHNTS